MEGHVTQIKEWTDIEKIYKWLEKAGLKEATDSVIMAAQDQALNTSSKEDEVYLNRWDPRWRQRKEASEAVQNITAGCKVQVHLEGHDQVAGIVYRNICAEYRLEVPGSKVENTSKGD